MPTKKELYREIDTLESRINSYKRVLYFYGKDLECSICKTNFDEYHKYDDTLFMTGCGHHFHFGCLRKWLEHQVIVEDANCPLCRTKFNNLVFYELMVNYD